MANDMRYLSAEEEAKLLKPIDEYVGKIQAQIDALRVDGSDQVQALKTHISLTKEDKNYTKEEQNEIIRKDRSLSQDAPYHQALFFRENGTCQFRQSKLFFPYFLEVKELQLHPSAPVPRLSKHLA